MASDRVYFLIRDISYTPKREVLIKHYISDLFQLFLLNHYMYKLLFITHFLQSLRRSAVLRFILNARRSNVLLTPHHPLLHIVE